MRRFTQAASAQALCWLSFAACVGCTTLLGIDEEYRPKQDAAGAGAGGTKAPTGGSAGSGGSMGGVGGGGGDSGGIGGAGGSACAPGEKLCPLPNDGGEACVRPQAIVGCSPDNCIPCEGAPNADPICNDDQCGLQCSPGYQPADGRCELIPDGGTGGDGGTTDGGGTSGSGGSGGSTVCSPMTCANTCNLFGPIKCCKQDKTCGCHWPPAPCY